MTQTFKSPRHAALNNTFPADGFEKLLSTGAMTGPHKRTRPLTLTWRMRVVRWVRSFINTRSPL